MIDNRTDKWIAGLRSKQVDHPGLGLWLLKSGIDVKVPVVVEAETLRALASALCAADRILWMAENYADAGGSRSIERVEFDEANAEIQAALQKIGGAS